jgi:hypothetical protein
MPPPARLPARLTLHGRNHQIDCAVATGDEVERIIREIRPEADFSVVFNPEFLREGAAIRDFKLPDRIVIGVEEKRASKITARAVIAYDPAGMGAGEAGASRYRLCR